MSFTKDQRASSWNVEVWGNGPFRLAGVYQRDNLLSVADIAYELDLCLIFERPVDDGVAPWQPALLRRDPDPDTSSLIVLDQQDGSPFPTPPLSKVTGYSYVFHSSNCARRGLHSVADTCIRHAGEPKRRIDPRYLEIGKKSVDNRHQLFQTRNSSTKRRSASSSRNPSSSPSRTDITETEIPSYIPQPEGTVAIRTFRSSVFQSCQRCVITGNGNFGNSAGPGLEAAHIVPQSQWHTYPIYNDKSIADPESIDQLGIAWRAVWRCFDARVLAIHPKTHLVRAFIDYDIATNLHGLHATIPRLIPAAVLQYHWDICCLENTPSSVTSSGVLSNVPEFPLPAAKVRKVFHGDPYKEDSNTQGSGTQASSSAPASDTRVFKLNPYQATAQAPSPPLSELGSAERALWSSGKGYTKGPDTAQELRTEVGSLEEINNDEEYGRGRSREKRRCLATQEDAEDDSNKANQDRPHKTKRQRVDSSPDST